MNYDNLIPVENPIAIGIHGEDLTKLYTRREGDWIWVNGRKYYERPKWKQDATVRRVRQAFPGYRWS